MEQQEQHQDIFLTFYLNEDREASLQEFPEPPKNKIKNRFEWLPNAGDVSIFSLHGFQVREGTNFIINLHFKIGNFKWLQIVIPTTELQYSSQEREDPPRRLSFSQRRRSNSFYYSGPPDLSNLKIDSRVFEKTQEDLYDFAMKYEASSYFDPKLGAVAQILILKISLCIPHSVIIDGFEKTKHYTVCMLQSVDREQKQAVINQLYLGRAQNISSPRHVSRIYEWNDDHKTKKQNSFTGIPFRESKEDLMQEASELKSINSVQGNLSARYDCAIISCEPDSNEYSNPNCKLPAPINGNQNTVVILKFYSFECLGEKSQKCIFESVIRNGEFFTKKKEKQRKSWSKRKKEKTETNAIQTLEKSIGDFKLTINYHVETNNNTNIIIKKITFCIENYENKINKFQPNTF